MQPESRVKKTLLNARVNLVFYFLTLALSFFSRRVFLDCLGADFVGLTGTLQNLLGFLNLAELGIGSAIGYVLYKPIYDHDQAKINEIISVMGYLYRWIGLAILGGGIVLALFLPLIFPGTEFEMGIIYFAYFSFLASSLIGYFINYRQNLLGADQRNYVVTAYYQSMTIAKTLIQMASAHYTGSYYLWVAIELAFGIIYSFILNWKINQTYPWLKTEVREGRRLFRKYPEVMKYTRQLFVHQISAFAQFRISPFLIYAYVSLSTVALYGNYTILFDKIDAFINNLLGSVGAGVGNLIAEGNKEKIQGVFRELMSFRFLLCGIIIFGLLNFTNPFITLWLGAKYLLPDIVLYLLLVNFFLSLSRSSTDPFLFGSGMFYDTWAPVTETVTYVVVAVACGHLWGLPGVILGNTVSLFLIIGIWKPTFLFVKGFKIPVIRYWYGWAKLLVIMMVCLLGAKEVMGMVHWGDVSTWGGLVVAALAYTALFAVVYSLLLLALSASFRKFVYRFYNQYKVKFKS